MANVLGELFGDIAGAIRNQTGDTVAMKPAQFPEKIWEIGKIFILEKQQFDGFALDESFGAYTPGYMSPSPFALNSGEKYRVVWDDMEWECTAVQVSNTDVITTVMGNGYALGLPDTGEPFLIVYNRVVNSDADSALLLSDDETMASHRVCIWQEPRQEINLQSKTITQNGEYTADLGFDALGKVTVAVAGSGDGDTEEVKAEGTFRADSETAVTIRHNLGVVPESIIIRAGVTLGYCYFAIGHRSDVPHAGSIQIMSSIRSDDGHTDFADGSLGIETAGSKYAGFRNANETTVEFGGQLSKLDTTRDYSWFAVGHRPKG